MLHFNLKHVNGRLTTLDEKEDKATIIAYQAGFSSVVNKKDLSM